MKQTQSKVDWEEVYRTMLPRIYNFFVYQLGDADTAKDLTAETFEQAWKSRHRYNPERATITTWIFMIACRRAGMYYRKKSRTEVSLSPTLRDGSTDLDEQLQSTLDHTRLRELVRDLPDREREIISLKYGAGMNNRQIAQMLQLTDSNVGSIVHRTIKQLKGKWEQDHGRR